MSEVVAGIDWASEEHALCVLDGEGRIVHGGRVGHDEAGLRMLCDQLLELEVARVAIERPDGLLVERLLDAGLPVIALHPNQVAAARPRFTASGAKSDSFDAFVLAELARTDAHRFRVLVPDSDATKALRVLTRGRDELVGVRVGLANQLRTHLQAFWPGAAKIFADVDSPIALAFLERYPSPADAQGLGPKRLAAFLARHGYCGRKPVDELLGRLRTAAQGRAGTLEAEARRSMVLAYVAALRPLVEHITGLEAEIRQALADHPDGRTFRSLFKAHKTAICPATILAEMGDCRDRYPTRDTLAADAGQAPVAIESGKSKHARFRWACDHRLRAAIHTLADASRHTNPWANDIYTRARARGCSHPHALRILGRAWTHILWRLWHDRTTYDPHRHTAHQRLITAQG